MSPAEFDRFARSYEKDLAKSLAVTGESRAFYALKRIEWTAQCVVRLGDSVGRILDYGCGDGANAPLLAERFQAGYTVGVDVSAESISAARSQYRAPGLEFLPLNEWVQDGTFDLAFTNGVFHHIKPTDRMDCLQAIGRALRPEGLFAFWENNPWNPGTHYVMSECVFDEQAVKISPREAKRMLAAAGFTILQTDSLFYFPRQLSFLRPAEAWLRHLPLGGQFLVLCRNKT